MILPDILISIFSIYIAGDIFLSVSYRLGDAMKLSQKSTGLFIVGFAAIIDEIIMAGMAAYQHLGSVSFGVIQGSNILTLLGFFIVASLFLRSGLRNFRFDAIIMAVSSIIIFFIALYVTKVPYYAGFFTLLPFIIYVIKKWKENSAGIPMEEKKYPYYYGIMTVAIIILASYNMINSALVLSSLLHINNFVSSFFLLGFFGSLPELIMMTISMKNGKHDVSAGLITGSTVYKESILFSIIAFTGTLSLENSFYSIIMMIVFSFVLFLYTAIFK